MSSENKEHDTSIEAMGHLIIDEVDSELIYYDVFDNEKHIIDTYGYASEPNRKVFLCSFYTYNYIGQDEPYYVMDWPMV